MLAACLFLPRPFSWPLNVSLSGGEKNHFRTLHARMVTNARQRKEGNPLLFKQTLRSRLTILRVFESCLFQTFKKVFLDCLQPAFSLKICLVLIPASEIVNNDFTIENLPWVPETFHARAFHFSAKAFEWNQWTPRRPILAVRGFAACPHGLHLGDLFKKIIDCSQFIVDQATRPSVGKINIVLKKFALTFAKWLKNSM